MGRLLILAAAGLVLAMGIGTAKAVPIAPFGNDGPGTGLQDQLDLLLATPINVDTGQSGAGLFTLTDLSNGSNTLILEIAGNAGTNTFGIYDPADPTNTLVELFNGGNDPQDQVTLSFVGLTPFVGVNTSGKTYSSTTFGFYIGAASGIFYSQPSLNGNSEQFVSFFGNGSAFQGALTGQDAFATTDAILAFEDLPVAGSDKDYNDLVVLSRNLQAVPEPATLALLGTGLLGLGAMLRRRRDA